MSSGSLSANGLRYSSGLTSLGSVPTRYVRKVLNTLGWIVLTSGPLRMPPNGFGPREAVYR